VNSFGIKKRTVFRIRSSNLRDARLVYCETEDYQHAISKGDKIELTQHTSAVAVELYHMIFSNGMVCTVEVDERNFGLLYEHAEFRAGKGEDNYHKWRVTPDPGH
jgi:hypothetical protein